MWPNRYQPASQAGGPLKKKKKDFGFENKTSGNPAHSASAAKKLQSSI
jgi:hypothetical protein